MSANDSEHALLLQWKGLENPQLYRRRRTGGGGGLSRCMMIGDESSLIC